MKYVIFFGVTMATAVIAYCFGIPFWQYFIISQLSLIAGLAGAQIKFLEIMDTRKLRRDFIKMRRKGLEASGIKTGKLSDKRCLELANRNLCKIAKAWRKGGVE